MKSNIWAKTLLTVYRYLERMAGAIDKMIETRSINSIYMTTANYYENNILSLSEKIIDLSERKIKLINTKILIENGLKKCGESYARILIGKYIDCRKNSELCDILGLPYRTYFRRLSDAEMRFENAIDGLGFDNKKLEKYLANEKWILFARDRIISTKSGDEIELKEKTMDRLIAI